MREEYPKGHPKNPLTREEAIWKFKRLAGKAIPNENHLNKIIDSVNSLEEYENISDFVKLLTKN